MKKVVVIGDIILDRYVFGKVNRTSPEAPVSVLDEKYVESQLGGAANVARCIKNIGEDNIEVQLIGIVGDDDEGNKVELLCYKNNINPCVLHRLVGHQTTLKTRYMDNGHHLLRVDREKEMDYNVISSVNIGALLKDASVVVMSDYDKGALNSNTINLVIDYCNENGIPTVVDPKFANFWEYNNATIFKPNRKELTHALYHKFGKHYIEQYDIDVDIFTMATKANTKLQCKSMVVTDGERGMSLIQNGEVHFKADVRDIIDVTGAGDMVASTIAYFIATDVNITDAVKYANIAAGLSVEQVGCGQVSLGEIINSRRNK